MVMGSGFTPEGATKPSSIDVDAYEPAVSAKRVTEIPSNLKKRFAWLNGNCTYTGYAPKGLEENENGWMLWKFTYDLDGNCTEINIAYGNWSDRATYTYN